MLEVVSLFVRIVKIRVNMTLHAKDNFVKLFIIHLCKKFRFVSFKASP